MNGTATMRDRVGTTILTILSHLAIGLILICYLGVAGIRAMLRSLRSAVAGWFTRSRRSGWR